MAPVLVNPVGFAATFIVSEARGYRSREQAVVASGAGKVPNGMIMARRSSAATRGSSSAAAAGGNTGNGTLGTLTADNDAGAGVYRARFLDADTFAVYGPGGEEVGRGAPGAAFNGPVNFTITAGGTPFAAGDGFDITVTAAAGSGEYVPYDPAGGATGADKASAILFETVDATDVAVKATFIVRDAEVQRAALAFAGTPTNGQKDAAYAALAAAGIAFR